MDEFVKAEDVKDLLNGLDSLPWEDEVEDMVNGLVVDDVAKVVRCCECVYKQENPDINNTCFLTCNLSWGLQGVVDPTDFCSYGKRKID